MKIKTALILCAGYGKRLNPLTLETPKPLLKFRKLSMLEHTIKFIENLGITKIKINTFHLEKKIFNFISNYPSKKNIEVISDGKDILGTGGGILNLMNYSDEDMKEICVRKFRQKLIKSDFGIISEYQR